MLADSAVLPASLVWSTRVAIPLSAILISAGFFASVPTTDATNPNGLVSPIYLGAVVPAFSVVALGMGLLRIPSHKAWPKHDTAGEASREKHGGGFDCAFLGLAVTFRES